MFVSKNISRTIPDKEITFGKTRTNTHKTLVRISFLRTRTYQKINLRAQKRQPRYFKTSSGRNTLAAPAFLGGTLVNRAT